MSATKAHAKFSASASERWMNCPGSISISERAPPQRTSAYAEEGTQAHSCLEELLQAHITMRKPYTRALALKKKFPHEMVAHALKAFTWIIEEAHGEPILCETKVKLPVSEPDQFGTVDAAIVEIFGTLTVIDYKYGAGIPVNPKDNSQLIYYALGLAHEYDYNFADVRLVIIQPRADTGDGGIRTHVMSIEEIQEWRERFEAAISQAKQTHALVVAGKWCRFCPAATICPVVSSKALEQARIDFDPVQGNLDLPTPNSAGIAISHLPQILDASERIEEWISKVREHAAHVLERGEAIPGWKLVPKRSTRKWTDIEITTKQAKKLFGKQAFTTPELLSPAQLEKVNPKKTKDFVAAHTSNISSGTTLVQESDPRPSVNPVALDFHKIEPEGGTQDEIKTRRRKAPETRVTLTPPPDMF